MRICFRLGRLSLLLSVGLIAAPWLGQAQPVTVNPSGAALESVALRSNTAAPARISTSSAPFAAEIQAFRNHDATNRPAEDIVEFVGSSTIRLWANVAEDMAPLPVFNRGFGGSKTTDLLYYMDEIVLDYKPRVIVLYCGTNDFDSKSKDGREVYERTVKFFERVAARLPRTKIVYISCVRCPVRKASWSAMNDLNDRVQHYMTTHPTISYVDINVAVAGADGQPREELFEKDRLHFNAAGYRQIRDVVKTAVQAAYK
jgi:lysophospholipase L1-like esterase